MVFFELALGKGLATVGSVGCDLVVKAASTSSTGAVAAAFIGPPPGLHPPPLQPTDFLGPSPALYPVPTELHGLPGSLEPLDASSWLLSSHATHGVATSGFWTDLESLGSALSSSLSAITGHAAAVFGGVHLATAAVPLGSTGFGLAMHHWWTFADEGEDEDEGAEGVKGLMWVVPSAVKFCVLNDSFMSGVLLQSLVSGQHPASPLRLWVLGGLALSLPVTWLVKKVVARFGVRAGFLVESAAMVASFMWLSWGTVLLSTDPFGAAQAPLLWWSCFVQVVATWSWIALGVSCMILSTVLFILLGK